MCALAGAIAEHRFTGRRSNVGARHDRNHVADIVFSVVGSANQANAYIAWLEARTTDILANVVWSAVGNIARALLKRETLSSKEVGRLYDEALYGTREERPERGSASKSS